MVVDSSKHASLAFCLRCSPGVDLRVVHMVRDSRAVAYSWDKVVDRPESAGSQMATYKPAKAALRWNLQNSALQLLSQLGMPTLRVRYEDFVRAPAATLSEIAGVRRHAAAARTLDSWAATARPLVGRTGGHPHRVGQPDAVHHRPDPDPLR